MRGTFVLRLLATGAGPVSLVRAQSAGDFTATGSMSMPRFFHTATLLADVRVLIAGGSVGVVKSADGRASWTLMNTGLPLSLDDWFGVTALVIDLQNPKTLYAALAGKVFQEHGGNRRLE